jgi:hypothetical protein
MPDTASLKALAPAETAMEFPPEGMRPEEEAEEGIEEEAEAAEEMGVEVPLDKIRLEEELLPQAINGMAPAKTAK